MKAVSTSDVSLDTLRELSRELAPDLELEVDEAQVFMRSVEPPSWVTLLCEADWWTKGFAASAALFIAEIVKEAAKETWKNRGKAVAAVKAASNAVKRLGDALATLRIHLSPRTRVELGLPVPDEHFPTRLELIGSDADILAIRVALFVHHLPALAMLIRSEGLDRDRAAGGVCLTLLPDASLDVSWQDDDSGKVRRRVLTLAPARNANGIQRNMTSAAEDPMKRGIEERRDQLHALLAKNQQLLEETVASARAIEQKSLSILQELEARLPSLKTKAEQTSGDARIVVQAEYLKALHDIEVCRRGIQEARQQQIDASAM